MRHFYEVVFVCVLFALCSVESFRRFATSLSRKNEALSRDWIVDKVRKASFKWWMLATEVPERSEDDDAIDKDLRKKLQWLAKKQRHLIERNPGSIDSMVEAAKVALYMCQREFRDRKWNCGEMIDRKRALLHGNFTHTRTREMAFVQALHSAAVTWTTSKACAKGSMICGPCKYNQDVNETVVNSYIERAKAANQRIDAKRMMRNLLTASSGKCSDNIAFGYHFSRLFTDSMEKGRTGHSQMLLHNNNAGRKITTNSISIQCKCHGYSGSCMVRTCWKELPPFANIAKKIKRKFNGASKVIFEKQSKLRGFPRLKTSSPDLKVPGITDLVYLDYSPNFCEPNSSLDLPGTSGRLCNQSSLDTDGCSIMCCDRDHVGTPIHVKESYNLKFDNNLMKVVWDERNVTKIEYRCR